MPYRDTHHTHMAFRPHIDSLKRATEAAGHILLPRLPSYPSYCTSRVSNSQRLTEWHDEASGVVKHVLRAMDSQVCVFCATFFARLHACRSRRSCPTQRLMCKSINYY
jgi:hypothetical protein